MRHRLPRIRPGTSPGSLSLDPLISGIEATLTVYGPTALKVTPLDAAKELPSPDFVEGVAWIDITRLGDLDWLGRLATAFDLHPLALEDAIHVGQRPKVDDYEDHLYIVAQQAVDAVPGDLRQVSIFLGPNYVLSVREAGPDPFEGVRRRLENDKGRLRRNGADYLAYALLDTLVDGFFPVLDRMGSELEALEEEVYADPVDTTLVRVQTLRRQLRHLRRAAAPHRDVVAALLREEGGLVREATHLYLRDCADHAAHVTETIDGNVDWAGDLAQAYLSNASNRMNEVMKVLTVVASIFIPLSFIAGVYGMNFDPGVSPWNMPELHWTFGYPMAIGLMLAVGLGLLWVFKRKGWIGS